MVLVALQADVLLVVQTKQEGPSQESRDKRHRRRGGITLNGSHLTGAKYLILDVATAKLLLHRGTRGSIEHLLFNLQTSEGEISASVNVMLLGENMHETGGGWFGGAYD